MHLFTAQSAVLLQFSKLGDSSERLAAGVLLYDGDATVGFGDRLWAVPISTLWDKA